MAPTSSPRRAARQVQPSAAADVSDLIERHRERLSPAERRVADVVLRQPELVAFGTVAAVAGAASTSGATVVRLASRLGLDGYVALQAGIRSSLSARLRPAADKIRADTSGDLVARTLVAEARNVAATLEAVDRGALDAAVALLADHDRAIWVLAGDAERGVADQFAVHLGMTRSGVRQLDGPPPRVVRLLADLARGDVVVVVDFRRHERWVLETASDVADAGALLIVVTDGRLSPLAGRARASFVIQSESAGPFDSHTATLAVLQLLVASTAARIRRAAAKRLDRIEAGWHDHDALAEI